MPIFVQALDPDRMEELGQSVVQWAVLWGVPNLGNEISLRLSSRFRRSLGSYRASRAEITLAAWLVNGPADLLNEVLCHEAAHAAVHFVHGEHAKPHGNEWQRFMKQAEVPARVRIPTSELPRPHRIAMTTAGVWEHRCPVCQTTRLARSRVTRWRCSRCRSRGRSGELAIERVPGPIAVDG